MDKFFKKSRDSKKPPKKEKVKKETPLSASEEKKISLPGGAENILDEDSVSTSGPSSSVGHFTEDVLSKDWQFNAMLINVADEITDEDLKKMKLLMSGEDGTGRKALEQIKNGMDLVKHLQHRGKLDRYNLIHLQALVWKTKNMKLHRATVEFAKASREQPIIFFPVNQKVEDEKQNVHFHVSGRATKGTDIENLRQMVAYYLCVPPEEVKLNGLKPFESIIITFLVPKQTAECLLELSQYQKRSLQDMKIDQIKFGESIVNLKGEHFDEIPILTENDEIRRITAAKSTLENELENLQAQLLVKEREITGLRAKCRRDQEALEKAQNLLKEQKPIEKSLTGSITEDLTVLVDYKHLLEEIELQYPGAAERVKRLLELKSQIIRKTETDLWKTYSDALQKYLEYLLNMHQIPRKPKQLSDIDEVTEVNTEKRKEDESEIDAFDQAIHELSSALGPAEKEGLKIGITFTISEEEVLDKEPHKFFHILLRHKCENITDTEEKLKHAINMTETLKSNSLDAKAKSIFKSVSTENKGSSGTTRDDPKNRAVYVRSLSVDNPSSWESVTNLYKQIDAIKLKLCLSMGKPL